MHLFFHDNYSLSLLNLISILSYLHLLLTLINKKKLILSLVYQTYALRSEYAIYLKKKHTYGNINNVYHKILMRRDAMFCTNCGTKLEGSQNFCYKCGAAINNASVVQNAAREISIEPEKKKKSRKPLIITAAIAGAALLIGAGGIFAGNTILNNNYKQAMSAIEDTKIPSFIEESENIAADWEDFGIFNLLEKNSLINDLKSIEKGATEAVSQLNDYEKNLAALLDDKDNFSIIDDYDNYVELLKKCEASIKDRQLEDAKDQLDKASKMSEELKAELKTELELRLKEYENLNLDGADVTDKNTYTASLDSARKLYDKNDIKGLIDAFNELDVIYYQYADSENELNVNVQQIDASNYPVIKLYLDIEDISTGELPSDLTDNSFFIRKKDAQGNYTKQTINKLSQLNSAESLSMNMVADVSGSMQGTPLTQAKQLMCDFVKDVQFSAGDKIELTSFSTGVNLQREFCDDANSLITDINNLTTGDMTSLYDALYTAVTRTATQTGAKCVIAFTDGDDNYSKCTYSDVITIAQRYHIPVFIIGIGSVNASDLRTICEQTGGNYYSASSVNYMGSFYEEIYREEKELYLMEFEDTTSAGINETSNILVGYHSKEYGGETAYRYTPNILNSIDGKTLYTSGPEAVVEGYLKGFPDAMTNQDFSYISDYLKQDSAIYNTQKEYVKKGISEKLHSYEIMNVQKQDENNCTVSTRETYYIQKENQPLELMTQECTYRVVKDGNDWKITEFVDLKVTQRINQ